MSSSAKAVKVTKKESEKYRRSLVEKKEEISQEMLKNKDAGQENARQRLPERDEAEAEGAHPCRPEDRRQRHRACCGRWRR